MNFTGKKVLVTGGTRGIGEAAVKALLIAGARVSVNGSSAETRLNGIAIEKGDTIDFLVDGKRDPENDGFSWAPVLKVGDRTWAAQSDFAGPVTQAPGVWARYAHVLLETNEFAFVD